MGRSPVPVLGPSRQGLGAKPRPSGGPFPMSKGAGGAESEPGQGAGRTPQNVANRQRPMLSMSMGLAAE